jgi:putative PIG3 family NAD(P)H quinone oxidoreductase
VPAPARVLLPGFAPNESFGHALVAIDTSLHRSENKFNCRTWELNPPFTIYDSPFTIHRMKAVVIISPGGPEVLEVREVETPPRPTADRVRVRVRAAGLNRADVLQRRGHYPAPPGYPQDIPGLEFAGEVEEVGEQATGWKRGQRVFGITAGGAQAEYVVVPEHHLAEIPANLDWPEAAAVPEVFITAHDALFTRTKLQTGETMLVHAAGSGVGTAAIQLARAAGAQAFGTSRTAEKLERARLYGLRNSVVVNDEPQVFAAAVQDWTNGRGVNVIIDLVGATYLEANLSALALMGRMVLVGTTAGARATLDFATVMRKRLTIIGTVLRARSSEEKATATRLFANHVVPLLADGLVQPVVDRVYKLEEVRDAHLRMESNESFGKIVLMM